jgi:hypothetical protein
MKVLRCEDIAHFYLPCGASHGYPIGAQDDDYHWHLADDDGNLFASYHAACKPPVPPFYGYRMTPMIRRVQALLATQYIGASPTPWPRVGRRAARRTPPR